MRTYLNAGICLMLFACGVLSSPGDASGALVPTTAGPTLGIDDLNTSGLNPSPASAVSNLATGQCDWINTGLDAFEASHPGWSHQWASTTEMAKVEQGISILDYYAWVVSEPTNITDGNGTTWTTPDPALASNNNVNDVGGAVMNLKYTPVAGAHVFTDLHWVEGFYAYYNKNGAYNGANFQTGVDTFSTNTPFYDDGGTAGKLAGGGGWFLDIPFKIEDEDFESSLVADVQFQVVLADYNSASKTITLYGGEWWGYKYHATDVPEPTVVSLLALGGLAMLRRRRAGRPVSCTYRILGRP